MAVSEGGNYAGEEGGGEKKKDKQFSQHCRDPAAWIEAGQRRQRRAGGGTHCGMLECWNVGEDLQDRVFLFAGGIVVDVFCEMVHFAVCVCVCVLWGGGESVGVGCGRGWIYGRCWRRRWWWGRQSRTQTLAPSPLLNDTPLYSVSLPPTAPANTHPPPTPRTPHPTHLNLSPLALRSLLVRARSFSRPISAFLSAMAVDTESATPGPSSEAPAKKRKLIGREFYESIGSPKTIVAPMVEQSEYVCRSPPPPTLAPAPRC